LSKELKDLETKVQDLATGWEGKFKELETRVGEATSTLQNVEKSLSSVGSSLGLKRGKGEDETPYRCKGESCKGLHFETVEDYVEHAQGHLLENIKKIVQPPEAPKPVEPEPAPRRHKTADEFVDCPECRKSLEESFKKHGFTVIPTPKEEPRRKGIFR